MPPNVTLHVFRHNDLNGSVLETITDEAPFFKSLHLHPERDGLGGAELILARNADLAGLDADTFDAEYFVRVLLHAYSDTVYWPWGFSFTKRELTVIHVDEDGAEEFHLGGPGPKQYLTRGVLGIGTPSSGWNVDLANGVWRFGDSATVGTILERVLAQDGNEDDPALPDLTLNFDETEDSASVPWADTDLSGSDANLYRIPIGNSFLETLWDLDDVIELSSWIDLGTVASPKFELNVIQGLGPDKTGSSFGAGVCLLREGVNIADGLEAEGISLKKASHVIVEGSDGKWAEAVRPGFSSGDFVKRVKIEYTRSNSVYWLNKAGIRWLKRQDYGEREITVEILPGAADASGLYFPAPDRVLWLNHLISLDSSADGSTKGHLDYSPSEDQLVTGFEVDLGPAGDTATATSKARSWGVKVKLNKERPGVVSKTPSQASSTSGGPGPRCCSPFPPECDPEVDPGDTLLTDSDDSGWLGSLAGPDTDGFSGTWRSVGGSGGTSIPAATVSGLSPGDYSITLRLGGSEHKYTGAIQVRDSTAVNPPIDIAFPVAVRAPGGHGSVTAYSQAFELPTGYDRIRFFHAPKMGGWRYQAELYALAAPPADDGYCIPAGSGGDPSDPAYNHVPHYNDPRFEYGAQALGLIDSYFHEAAVDPTAGDDNTLGFLVGSIWVNTASDEAFVATDVSTGAANWESATAGGGGGAPTTADYLVGTAQGGLSAEIVVGTTPGGELGGTWGSPTVDASHSGSSHAGVIAAHEALSDPHTGYRLESADHSHASTGLQGGTVAHSVLTGVTANQHHNEDHQARHLDGGADPIDVTDLDGYPGGTTTFLRADGSFATPGPGGGGPIGEGRPAGVGAPTMYVLPGLVFYFAPSGSTTGTLGTGTRYYQPIIVQEEIDLVALVAECTGGAAAGRALRGGLYEADASWQPGNLVLEGAFDCSTTGVKTIAGGPTTLIPGRYLTCMESNHATPIMRLWHTATMFAATGASLMISHLSLAGTSYGALPNPGSAWTSVVAVGAAAPTTQHRIVLQVNP